VKFNERHLEKVVSFATLGSSKPLHSRSLPILEDALANQFVKLAGFYRQVQNIFQGLKS